MRSHVPHSIFPKLLSFARKFPFRPPKHPCFPVYLLTPCDLCSLPCHLYMTLKPSSSVVLFQSPSHLVFYWALSFGLNIFLVTFFPLPIQPSLSPPLSLSFHNFFLLNYSQVFVTQWTIALQAPVSMEFFRQEFWSRLPFPSPGNPSHQGIKSTSPVAPALQVDSLLLAPPVYTNIISCNFQMGKKRFKIQLSLSHGIHIFT